jgi:hypothetical protein
MAKRKPGQRDPLFDSDPMTSVSEVLKYIPQFFRKDFGGANQGKVIRSRLSDAHLPINPDTIQAYLLGAEQTRTGIRNRVMPRIKWLQKLFS